jgi:hypothetical protein
MVAGITGVQSPHNFLLNQVFIGYRRSQISELNHTHALNAEETITQSHVQNHQIHQPSVHCVEETIPQATKGCEVYKNLQKTEASQATKLLTDPPNKESILAIILNSLLSAQIKLQFKCSFLHKSHTHKHSSRTSNLVIHQTNLQRFWVQDNVQPAY